MPVQAITPLLDTITLPNPLSARSGPLAVVKLTRRPLFNRYKLFTFCLPKVNGQGWPSQMLGLLVSVPLGVSLLNYSLTLAQSCAVVKCLE
jgi:hypothetical protein